MVWHTRQNTFIHIQHTRVHVKNQWFMVRQNTYNIHIYTTFIYTYTQKTHIMPVCPAYIAIITGEIPPELL